MTPPDYREQARAEIDALASALEVEAHNEGYECALDHPHDARPKAARRALLEAFDRWASRIAEEERAKAEGRWMPTALYFGDILAATACDLIGKKGTGKYERQRQENICATAIRALSGQWYGRPPKLQDVLQRLEDARSLAGERD